MSRHVARHENMETVPRTLSIGTVLLLCPWEASADLHPGPSECLRETHLAVIGRQHGISGVIPHMANSGLAPFQTQIFSTAVLMKRPQGQRSVSLEGMCHSTGQV